jgi:hypothetical protein
MSEDQRERQKQAVESVNGFLEYLLAKNKKQQFCDDLVIVLELARRHLDYLDFAEVACRPMGEDEK